MVGQVIIYGNPVVDCSVWRKLSETGISALLMPARGKGEPAFIGPGLSNAVMVRIAQHRVLSDMFLKTRAATWVLQKKIKGLIYLAGSLKKETDFFLTTLSRMDKAGSTDSLRGMEGAAAREWFAMMSDILPLEWGFTGRNRRPPKDPVNAMLSLGYTLLMSEIRKSVLSRGLDPSIGFLHDPYPGRDSLVLDLVEPFRPGVDAFVLALADGLLSPKDFTTGKQEGCRLSKDGRAVFYRTWEETKQNWPLSYAGIGKEGETASLPEAARQLVLDFVRRWDAGETPSKL